MTTKTKNTAPTMASPRTGATPTLCDKACVPLEALRSLERSDDQDEPIGLPEIDRRYLNKALVRLRDDISGLVRDIEDAHDRHWEAVIAIVRQTGDS
jgi:hypothetical protein